MTKIMIVDDSAIVRSQVSRALAAAAFAVVEAVDGLDALEKLAAHQDVALIVCDVNMPKMSGLDLLERLKAERASLPVVMLTTEGQPDMMVHAKSLGAKGWIVKPFRPELLVAAAKKLTQLVG